MSAVALLLSDDLLDSSRIVGIGHDAGVTIKPARTLDALVSLAGQEQPMCVLVDLSILGVNVLELLNRLREAAPWRPPVMAYGPHVDAEILRTARRLGCEVVLPRSAFFQDLPMLLLEWLPKSPG